MFELDRHFCLRIGAKTCLGVSPGLRASAPGMFELNRQFPLRIGAKSDTCEIEASAVVRRV